MFSLEFYENNAFFEWIATTHVVAGYSTVIVSFLAMIACIYHMKTFSRRLQGLVLCLFLVTSTDAALYLINILFGLWTRFEMPFGVKVFIDWLRVPATTASIGALLYLHYQVNKVKDEENDK